MVEERQNNLLLQESRKWKEFEENTLKLYSNYKSDCKQLDETTKILKNNIRNLSKTKCDIAHNVKLELCNKYIATTNISRIEELSEQINISCGDVKKDLEICKILQEKCKNKLENDTPKLNQNGINHENMLKSQKYEIVTLTENLNSYNALLSSRREKESLELKKLKNTEMKLSNELLLQCSNEHLKRELCELDQTIRNDDQEEVVLNITIKKEREFYDAVLFCLEDNKSKTQTESSILLENIVNIQEKIKNDQLIFQEYRNKIEEQYQLMKNLLNENGTLRCESLYHSNKYEDLQKVETCENNDYIQNSELLQKDIQLLNNELQRKEEDMVAKTNLKKDYIDNLSNKELDNKNEKIFELEKKLRYLTEDKDRVIDINNQEIESNNILSRAISNKTSDIQDLRTNIQKLIEKGVNYSIVHKTILHDLNKKISGVNSHIHTKRKEADTLKLNHKEYVQHIEFELLTNFDAKISKFENGMEHIKKENENINEKTKQLLHSVEDRTLECDILSRKIKTASELQISRKIELKPSVLIHKKFGEKRQIDETSDSSFDETIPFHGRMLMKKKNKKIISDTRMGQF